MHLMRCYSNESRVDLLESNLCNQRKPRSHSHQARRVGEPGVVHAVHTVPGRNLTRQVVLALSNDARSLCMHMHMLTVPTMTVSSREDVGWVL